MNHNPKGRGGSFCRVFIAIEIPRSVVPPALVEEIPSIMSLRPIQTPFYHLTLHFFGDVPVNSLDDIGMVLSGIAFPCFEVTISGVSGFPSISRSGVMVLKIQDNPALNDLHARIIRELGIFESKVFVPHISIARSKKKVNLVTMREKYDLISSVFKVTGFSLIQSTLTQSGPVYKTIRKYQCSGSGDTRIN